VAAPSELVVVAVQRAQSEVPALANLKLVFSLELTSGGLTGPGKSDAFRVELPGPKVVEVDAAADRKGDRLLVYHGRMRIPGGWWAVQPTC